MTASQAVKKPSNVTQALPYKRVLLKMSGEVLMGNQQFGIDPAVVARVAKDVKEAIGLGIQVCIVVGAGNIFRGVSGASQGMDRTTADYMGMLGICINALALQNALENLDVPTRVQSAIHMNAICEPYIRRKAMRHMEKGRVVIFAAARETPISRPIRRARCGHPKWIATPFSRAPRSTASTPPIRSRTRKPPVSSAFRTWTY